ncbi:MAG: M14 family murein peptide amidase A [Smithellaceae bacterium]|nr:M14 family murein peptide amidase A [Smithellaceae bacterium]
MRKTPAHPLAASRFFPGHRTFFRQASALVLVLCLAHVLFLSQPARAADPSPQALAQFLRKVDEHNARYGWKDIRCGEVNWEYHRTTQNRHPLIFARYGQPSGNCILFLGGVHGDELPTIYLMFKLADFLKRNPDAVGNHCVVIAPLVNPDGYLRLQPTRVNANGVDINRNFPTRRWHPDAHRQWQAKGKKNGRYYPGSKAASEQETLFQAALIRRFQPQKILSVHSPLNFFDYDGPSTDLDSFEKWMEKMSRETRHPLKKFGVYPGSLGNYAGNERGIFTLTLELPTSDPRHSAGYFAKFQSAFLKFVALPVTGAPPHTRLMQSGKGQ